MVRWWKSLYFPGLLMNFIENTLFESDEKYFDGVLMITNVKIFFWGEGGGMGSKFGLHQITETGPDAAYIILIRMAVSTGNMYSL